MKDVMKNGYSKIDVRFKNLSSMIMGNVESDEHLRIFKCLSDTGSHVLRNAIVIKLLNNNSISFVQYLENNKHQFYHQFEKRIWRKCCPGSPHGCVFPGTMDKKIFNKMYNKTAEHNTKDCLDRFETNAGISLDGLDLSDLNFFLWNSSSLSAQEEHSLKKIMSIRSAICHPSSSHSYSIDELEIYWSDLKSAVLLFAEPKCYKDIVEMQVETLQNCKLNVIESAKVIEKMKIESDKILHAIRQEAPLKIVEKLIKDGTFGLENCVKSENNMTKLYINDTFQEFKENIGKHHQILTKRCTEEMQTAITQESSETRLHSEDQRRAIDTKLTESENRVCQTVIQTREHLEDKLVEQQHERRKHNLEMKEDLREDNRKLTAEVMEMKTDIKELKAILIGNVGKQKVELFMSTEVTEMSNESSDKRKVDMTAKISQTHVTEDQENEIIEKLPPIVKVQTNSERLSEAAVTETVEITGKKVNSIILELKATPGILHSVETFKAAILTLVRVMQKAGGIDADIEDTVTVNLEFESSLTEDQFSVVKCLFAKKWNADNDTTQQPETSEVFQLKTTKPITKTFCQLCDNKDKRIKALEEQNEKHEIVIKRNILDRRVEKRKLEDLRMEKRKFEDLQAFRRKQEDSSSKKTLYKCKHCYEMEVIIIQLDRRLCEIRRRIIEAKDQPFFMFYIGVNKAFEDLLKITDQNTSITSIEEKGRMQDKELKRDRSSQDSKLIFDVDERDPEKKASKKLMESQAGQGQRPGLDQTEEKSDLSLRISEIRHEYGIKIGTFLWEKINRNPCNLCEIKDEQIRKLEKETQEQKQSIDFFKLRDAMLKTPQYNCRNCYEKDQMIIYLDRRLHETRQRVEHEKQISESSLLDDLMRLTSIYTTIDSVDENTELKEGELGSNVSSLKSGIISKYMEQVQSKDVQGTAPGQKQKMSNQSNRILELRYAYAANSYTKEEGQKGLAIIISKDIRNLMSQLVDKRISHSRDFFGEMGFQVEYFKDGNFQDFLFNIKHGNFYCVFVMVIDFQEFNFWAMYSSLAKQFRGKPKIIMVDSAKPQYPFGNIVEEPDTLFISMHEQFKGSYGQLKEFNVIDNFIAVTQCSRCTDIMEILTRINALYDRPVISFHSSFRKKFYFL